MSDMAAGYGMHLAARARWLWPPLFGHRVAEVQDAAVRPDSVGAAVREGLTVAVRRHTVSGPRAGELAALEVVALLDGVAP